MAVAGDPTRGGEPPERGGAEQMNTRDQRAEGILGTAMEMADPAARRAYLDRACGGDAA